jgi:amino-acid N-acetyltransferase
VLRSSAQLSEHLARALSGAVKACRAGVRRSHLIGRSTDGALLLELFTRDGIGTLVTEESYETLRPATIEDVGGILALIAPLERDGSLIRRSRELLEMEIDRFSVVERDGMIVGSAALYPFPDEHLAEVACVAVSPDYRGRGRGDQLLKDMEAKGRRLGLQRLFVLTTRTAQWFQERGFQLATLDELPVERKALYNYQRNSKVLIKSLRP